MLRKTKRVRVSESRNETQDVKEVDEADQEEDCFLSAMFDAWAADPYDPMCVHAYWTGGIAIRRERVRGRWKYWTVRD